MPSVYLVDPVQNLEQNISGEERLDKKFNMTLSRISARIPDDLIFRVHHCFAERKYHRTSATCCLAPHESVNVMVMVMVGDTAEIL